MTESVESEIYRFRIEPETDHTYVIEMREPEKGGPSEWTLWRRQDGFIYHTRGFAIWRARRYAFEIPGNEFRVMQIPIKKEDNE